MGAAFRSAAALGIDAVLVTPRCADPSLPAQCARLHRHRLPSPLDPDRMHLPLGLGLDDEVRRAALKGAGDVPAEADLVAGQAVLAGW